MATEASSWRFIPKKDDVRKGAQIDLVINRADKIIHLVEMKFSATPYIITKDYEQKLRARQALFMEMTNTISSAVHTFITPMGVAQGSHSSILHSQLTANALFAII